MAPSSPSVNAIAIPTTIAIRLNIVRVWRMTDTIGSEVFLQQDNSHEQCASLTCTAIPTIARKFTAHDHPAASAPVLKHGHKKPVNIIAVRPAPHVAVSCQQSGRGLWRSSLELRMFIEEIVNDGLVLVALD